MRRKIINGLLLTVTIAAMSAFVSCKDYAEDYYSELKGQFKSDLQTIKDNQIANLNTTVASLQTDLDNLKASGVTQEDLNDLETKLKNAMNDLNNCDCAADRQKLHNDIANLEATKANLADMLAADQLLQNAINNLANDLAALATKEHQDSIDLAALIEKANQAAQNAAALAQEAKTLAEGKADKATVQAIADDVATLKDQVVTLDERLTAVEAKAAEALAMATRDSLRLDAVKKALEDRLDADEKDIAQNKADIEQNKADIEQNRQDLAEAKEKYDNALKVINEALASLQDQINNIEPCTGDHGSSCDCEPGLTLEQVQAYMTPIVNGLQDQIDAVKDDLTALTDKLDKHIKDTEKYINDLASQIKGIILQGADSPVAGFFSLPINVKSNILAAYYGEPAVTNADGEVEFPTDRPALYVFADEVISEKAFEVIGGTGVITKNAYDSYIINDEEGNAGTLYLTINPAEVDFSGIVPKLVDSRDRESGITLSAIKPSSKTLYFGATRAERVYNGFYEAKATVDPAKINDIKPNFDINALKPLAKQLLNREIDLTNIYYTIQDQLKDVIVANGVKVEWTDTLGDHSIYSGYDIAATAIPALSYNFLADGIDKKFPTISPIGAFNLDVEIKLNGAVVTEPTPLSKLAYDPFEIWIDQNGDGVKDASEIYTGQGLAEFNKIIDQINADMHNLAGEIKDNVDDLIKEINDQVNDNMANVEDDLNARFIDKVNDVIAKVNKYIKKIGKFLGNPNAFLQPFLAYESDGAYHHMSGSQAIPTEFVFNGGTGIELIPTSYTAEIFAPAFQKFIAVTDVIAPDGVTTAQGGDATCKSLAQYANKTANYMNTVIPGKQTGIVFAPDPAHKEGYIYEITYAAVDYNGYNVAKKFYVRVK